MNLPIRHGKLADVMGRAVAGNGWRIMPALVELEGSSFKNDYHLHRVVGANPPAILKPWLKQKLDAHWVRARLPRVFGYTPALAETEKALLDEGFVAIPERAAAPVGCAFRCIDYYGSTGLMFSPAGPDEPTRREIAAAFWGSLLSAPEQLEDFDARVFHPGVGIWMRFSCTDGTLGYAELEDDGEDGGEDVED